MRHLLALAVTSALFVAHPAVAQEAAANVPPNTPGALDVSGDRITVAAAGVYLPDYEGSNDYRFTAAPAAIGSIKGYSFTLLGNRASVNLIRVRPGPGVNFELGPVGVIDINRDSIGQISDRRVKALGRIGTTVELGGYVGINKTGVITSPYDTLSATVSYRTDVGGVNHSYVITPSISYLTPLSRRAAAGLFGSTQIVGRRFAQTYESVSVQQSVASGLPAYVAHGGVSSYTLGAFATQSITGDLLHGLKLVAGGTYSRELGSFSYSPLTRIAGSPHQWIGAVGLGYTF